MGAQVRVYRRRIRSVRATAKITRAYELIAARAAGFNACKLFPAQQAGGIDMLKALGGPFPDHVFCPTGGVTRANAAHYLALPNVLCVGGSWLAPTAVLEAQDWAQIETLARDAAALPRSNEKSLMPR